MPRTPKAYLDRDAAEIALREVVGGPAATRAARLLGAACDVTRLNMLRALRRGPLAASDLSLIVGRTRSATSQHLRVLREADAVVAERRGNVVRYRLSDTPAAKVLADVCSAFDRLAA